MEAFGVENIKKVLAAVLEGGNVAGKIVAAKGSKWLAMANLMDLVDEVMALTTVKWDLLDDEYKDMSASEKEDVMTFIKEKFDIPQNKVEAAIERSLSIAMKLEGIIKETIALVKDLQAAEA